MESRIDPSSDDENRSIKERLDRLADDHQMARQLAQGLNSIAGIGIEPASVQTNIVVFEIRMGPSAADFVEQMHARGVRLTHFSESKIRAVTHRMINSSEIQEPLDRSRRLHERTCGRGSLLSANILAHEVPHFNAEKPSGQDTLLFRDQLKPGSLI